MVRAPSKILRLRHVASDYVGMLYAVHLLPLLFKRVQAAIVTMVTGAVMAGAEEVRLNLLGCFWIAICAVSTAGYLILIKLQKESLGEHTGLNSGNGVA